MKPPVAVADPPAVVTTTSRAPAVPDGVVMTIDVDVLVPSVADAPPTVTLVTPDRLVPLIVTDVAPPVGPELGEMPVMVGAAM